MTIEIPRGLPFSVDTWSPNSKRKRHHFLTHAHKDHSSRILAFASYPIYCTHLTKSLVLFHYPKLEESAFVCIEVGQPVTLADPDGEFKVTAFDANHCPGAVMFLFEGKFGNILHTGDCRLTPECIQQLPQKYIRKKGETPSCQLDYVFLDCTFGRSPLKFPSKHSATQQVINCIWKHPNASVVHLTCDLLGQEDILASVSQAFGSKIYVDKVKNHEYFQALMILVPEILTDDPSSRFHMLDGFPKLYERAASMLAEARANYQPEPLIIRPSAQWYACEDEQLDTEKPRKIRLTEAMKDQFGIWHVCYSMHSSREELEWALELLAPKWVVSTTPGCQALELDYVKKHCLDSRLKIGDQLWKLFDISEETTKGEEVDVPPEASIYSSAKEPSQSSYKVQEPAELLCSRDLRSNSPEKGSTLTLFGRARLSIEDPIIISLKNKSVQASSVVPIAMIGAIIKQTSPFKKNAGMRYESVEIDPVLNVVEQQWSTTVRKEAHELSRSVGGPMSFGGTMRNLYRSMNVPVPRPLPSLVKMMEANKRLKKR